MIAAVSAALSARWFKMDALEMQKAPELGLSEGGRREPHFSQSARIATLSIMECFGY